MARAQASSAPIASPSRADAELRQEAGRLAGTLMARRTEPAALWARLEVEVEGAVLDRRRVLDLTRERGPNSRALRVRFREPAALRGEALLLREEGALRRAWRYEPSRGRPEPIAWPGDDELLGGSGLRWRDLWGEDPQAWRYWLLEEGRLALGEGQTPVEVLCVRATSDRVTRVLYLEREHYLPLRVEENGLGGTRSLWRLGWRRREGVWVPSTLRIESPAGRQRVVIRELATQAPAAHLDPSRFQRE